jgi:hypothetical protein
MVKADGKNNHVFKTVLLAFTAVVLMLFLDFQSRRDIKHFQNTFFKLSIKEKMVRRVAGTAKATTVYLEDGTKFSFNPQYNEDIDYSFSTCVLPGDIVLKKSQTNTIYIIKENSKDTIQFQSIFETYPNKP